LTGSKHPAFSTNHLAVADTLTTMNMTTTKNNTKNLNGHARKLLSCA